MGLADRLSLRIARRRLKGNLRLGETLEAMADALVYMQPEYLGFDHGLPSRGFILYSDQAVHWHAVATQTAYRAALSSLQDVTVSDSGDELSFGVDTMEGTWTFLVEAERDRRTLAEIERRAGHDPL